jgi:ribonuclease VapC
MKVVVDSSVAMAILFGEADAEDLDGKLSRASERYMSPVNWWETKIQIHARTGQPGEELLTSWFENAEIEIVPISVAQAAIAIDARKRYGGRPARLNMGDCFAYALAKEKDAALLFKGDDFLATDVKRVT